MTLTAGLAVCAESEARCPSAKPPAPTTPPSRNVAAATSAIGRRRRGTGGSCRGIAPAGFGGGETDGARRCETCGGRWGIEGCGMEGCGSDGGVRGAMAATYVRASERQEKEKPPKERRSLMASPFSGELRPAPVQPSKASSRSRRRGPRRPLRLRPRFGRRSPCPSLRRR